MLVWLIICIAINLITLSSLMSSGKEAIPYHADGELCRYFSSDDIGLIIKAATDFKAYHTTYYNSLKSYIQSLNCKELLREVRYGIDIPEKFKSDILKDLTAQNNEVDDTV